MTTWLTHLDTLLRGERTGVQLLDDHSSAIPLRAFAALAVVLGMVYGFFMGWYGIAVRANPEYMQVLASMVKLPALFLLTLAVTFPSLYVFAALAGCRLTFPAVLRLLVAAIVVNLAVAASLGPILGFFTVSTTSYPFMVLLNVVLLGVAGLVGLGFLLASLRKIARSTVVEMVPPRPPPAPPPAPPAASPAGEQNPSADPTRHPTAPPINSSAAMYSPDAAAYRIFYIWVIIYGLVGAQMGWLLRPFIGHPELKFAWFRPRQGNFFQAVVMYLEQLFSR